MPVEAASDHQMKDEPELVFQANADAFAKAAELEDFLSGCAGEGWIRGAQKKWADDADSFERLAENALLEGFKVDGDVGEFGHESSQRMITSLRDGWPRDHRITLENFLPHWAGCGFFGRGRR
jgi:hypothetical protein